MPFGSHFFPTLASDNYYVFCNYRVVLPVLGCHLHGIVFCVWLLWHNIFEIFFMLLQVGKRYFMSENSWTSDQVGDDNNIFIKHLWYASYYTGFINIILFDLNINSIGDIIKPIVEMKKLSHRVYPKVAKCHSAHQGQSWDLNSRTWSQSLCVKLPHYVNLSGLWVSPSTSDEPGDHLAPLLYPSLHLSSSASSHAI